MTIRESLELADADALANSMSFRKACEREAIARFVATARLDTGFHYFEGHSDQPVTFPAYVPCIGTVRVQLPVISRRELESMRNEYRVNGPIETGLVDRIAGMRDRWNNGADDNNNVSSAVVGSTY